MKLPRRQFLHLAAGGAALAAMSRIARAQAYPARPVRAIVAFAPGGVTDTFARLMSQKLGEHLGKQFYVENITGATGSIELETTNGSIDLQAEKAVVKAHGTNGAIAFSGTLADGAQLFGAK